MHRIKASFAVGENCPVSILDIVFRDTPTRLAKLSCESPFFCRASFMRLRSMSLSSIVRYIIPMSCKMRKMRKPALAIVKPIAEPRCIFLLR